MNLNATVIIYTPFSEHYLAAERSTFELKCTINGSMTKSGNKKRKKLSSSSSTEGASSAEGKGDEAFESGKSAAMATNEGVNETPSLVDVWNVLTEIKANTVKLVVDVELLKANYNELKGSLYSTKSQVDALVTENIAVKSKLKLLEEQVLTSKKELEELKQRLYDAEGSHDDLEQYTRKFNLVIHGIPEREEEDNVQNVISLGNILKVNLTRGDIDIVHRLHTKNKTKTRPIIVRFSNYNAKSQLYKARINLRNATLHDLGAEKIFINENLTAWRARLFREARNVMKKFHNGKTWTVDGKIFLKTDLTAKVLKIDSYEDLRTL